ncbi:hypothetical protein F441_14172 [Phytophthora nicotianae CJ01A1]|uniref:Myb-like domain-containing protein n=3 Tax=Phytophthora nicotianae TaxID=4792 RepID=W2PVC3_PHYN3|nr:hypothetical protein PPTG_14663 [Phytophthora nicotianae INRA-310]ETN04913.1 hypothetical protein PPTG_14663 [Phytophthora nicotianae INRA-310]ETP10131.1 hypothetical protein F441_14172 [Phytophthora nicotianae CJ01A1]ETP38216.1 hypothetical protein F442_14117 [Phytophthora nicotianae P10297]
MSNEDHEPPPIPPDPEGVSTLQNAHLKPTRKKAFRFLPSSDVLLLKEVTAHTPWAAAHGETNTAWTTVANELKNAISASTADDKACRRRFTALLDTFRREEMKSLRVSGTAEEYREREQLLTDCLELEKANKKKRKQRDAKLRPAK